jgi:hypothetical protein
MTPDSSIKHQLHVVFLSMGTNIDACILKIKTLKSLAWERSIDLEVTISLNMRTYEHAIFTKLESYGTVRRRVAFIDSAEEHQLAVMQDFQKNQDALWILIASSDDPWIPEGMRRVLDLVATEGTYKLHMFDARYRSEFGISSSSPIIAENDANQNEKLLTTLSRRGYFYGPSKIGIFLYRFDSFSSEDLSEWENWCTDTVQFTHSLFNLRLAAKLGDEALSHRTPIIYSTLHDYVFDDNTKIMVNWYKNYRRKPHQYDWTIGQFKILNEMIGQEILSAEEISSYVIVDLIRGTVPLLYDFYWRLMIASKRALMDKSARISSLDIIEMQKFLSQMKFSNQVLIEEFSICLQIQKISLKSRLESYKKIQRLFNLLLDDPFNALLLKENWNYKIFKYFEKYVAISNRILPEHAFAFDLIRPNFFDVIVGDDLDHLMYEANRHTHFDHKKSLDTFLKLQVHRLKSGSDKRIEMRFPRFQIYIMRHFPWLVPTIGNLYRYVIRT